VLGIMYFKLTYLDLTLFYCVAVLRLWNNSVSWLDIIVSEEHTAFWRWRQCGSLKTLATYLTTSYHNPNNQIMRPHHSEYLKSLKNSFFSHIKF